MLLDLLGRLHGVVRNGLTTVAKCPAHDDHRQSLSITTGRDARLLLRCHAGCATPAIVDALGLTMADLFADGDRRRNGGPARGPAGARIVATYDYRDEAGTLLFQTVRLMPKDFRQRRPTGSERWAWNLKGVRLVLYRLDQLATLRPARLFLVEGEKDVDRLVALELPATTSPMGAGKWRSEYTAQLAACGTAEVILTPDHDGPGRQHMEAAGRSLTGLGLRCRWLDLLGVPEKGDVADWLAAGGTGAQLAALADAAPTWPRRTSLDAVHQLFHKRLGDAFDVEVLDIVLAVAAAERLSGDPAWLLVVSGPGNAKTETIQPLEGAGGIIVSTIASEGALLSASPAQARPKDATGGLLRQLGDRGLLVIKDVTSLLSADRNVRTQVIAAFREIHDGRWVRTVGVDGGKSLSWSGRIVVIGAVTTAWDAAHSVIAACGDRFLLVRADSRQDRVAKSQRARRNTGEELTMRTEFAAAVGQLLSTVPSDPTLDLSEAGWDELVDVADLVTLVRSGVETDYKGDVLFAHAPEVPTRLVKQLGQLMRGATAIGLSVERAFEMALRVCRDCAPDPTPRPPRRGRAPGHQSVRLRPTARDPPPTSQRLCDPLRALDLLDWTSSRKCRGNPG